MKYLPVLTILIIALTFLLLPKEQKTENLDKQTLGLKTSAPLPTPTPEVFQDKENESYSSFLVPKDLQ